MGTRYLLFISLICLLCCASCTSTSKVAYFQSDRDTSYRQNVAAIEVPFQKNDIIDVVISSNSKEASSDFNKADLNSKGYLVNTDGNIQLPILGDVKAEGLTKKQLKESITNKVKATKMLVDPLIDIRFVNFEVTVLGEVGHPAVITVPNEQITLVKALAFAGDLTIYGKRDNILLVREEQGVRKTRRININSADFLNSEYYYLRPNDLIYVEPNKTKLASTGRFQQALPIVLTGVSLLFLVFDKVIK